MEKAKAELSQRVEQLEAQVAHSSPGRHSGNSHWPPSADGPQAPKRPSKQPTGRRPGAQPGHEPQESKLLPAERVNEFKRVEPQQCSRCAGALQTAEQGPEPVRHQVVEVERIHPHITEWQLCYGSCEQCQLWTGARMPAGEPQGAFGPRLTALVGMMSGQMRLSKRQTQQWLESVLGVEVSLGSLSHLEEQVSAALEQPVAQASAEVSTAPVVHADETSWRQKAQRAWLWVAVTARLTLFLIRPHRDHESAQELLGKGFSGILVSDRYRAYLWVEPSRRQVCWAHLKRDFQGWVDSGGVGAFWGQALLEQTRQMFELYHCMKEAAVQRAAFEQGMEVIRSEVSFLLYGASVCPDLTVAGQAKAMLEVEPALWTFVSHEEVEPTNNRAERALRHAVLWRKSSGGTQSERGSLFVGRILTVIATLRQQGHDVLEYLISAMRAHLLGQPAPSLLRESG